ncbi:DNA-methyltransferase [Methanosarcina mazei]|jgi:site-specific DNA-methyltransferase (cytosine-N4-specific)|uniref:Type II methyltransferase n=2 Tax=Methanosarcina mazei TaxID=2209 RepID=A0A0F8H3N5_METMZ|nr:site-specific DNA-methyltransferase [Methanosarcina mazei]AKB67656.1 PvuII DNA methyltransferase [Methanosarcina mazei LYC]KKG00917.1 DNA methyltransferase [Methanosarcina mazei]KKG14011.1 DNA methyltransferase [Methanosarcina mazei]KKG32878.1 DNA methyltransferase [Methanosarcina mazei]KKG39205.1 DNA methyltransferase [Methanosarcina mazei]
MQKSLYKTELGKYYVGNSEELLVSGLGKKLKNKVQLILTSPPFPLNQKKKYGNLQGEDYKNWFIGLAEVFSNLLTDDGSIVIEMGNSWVPEKPVQSLLHLESLLGFVKNPNAGLVLCQEFICHNPSRLPSPAQWVTIERIRMTDSFTRIWWMSKSENPKADNRKVLRPYSKQMKKLLKSKKYNAGLRPSEHRIGDKSFLKDNGGSIMPNVIEIEQIDENKEHRVPNIFSIANTKSVDTYLNICKERGFRPHPARMPLELASFFIEFLTEKNDLVLDPFAGSNTTGYCAEKMDRRWISIEAKEEYGLQSKIRFEDSSDFNVENYSN